MLLDLAHPSPQLALDVAEDKMARGAGSAGACACALFGLCLLAATVSADSGDLDHSKVDVEVNVRMMVERSWGIMRVRTMFMWAYARQDSPKNR